MYIRITMSRMRQLKVKLRIGVVFKATNTIFIKLLKIMANSYL